MFSADVFMKNIGLYLNIYISSFDKTTTQVPKGVFHSDTIWNHFWFPKELSSDQFLKETFFS